MQKNDISLKNMAIGEFKKMQSVLDKCPLCQQDEKPPIAPVVSLATRVFLTLPTEPEIGTGGCVIVPIQHRTNMMECDDDEWEEVRVSHHPFPSLFFPSPSALPTTKPHATLYHD